MSDVLLTTCNQFGFKSKLGTDTCIYALKEMVENHRSLDGSMFMGSLLMPLKLLIDLNTLYYFRS